jgi:hypothetical protein
MKLCSCLTPILACVIHCQVKGISRVVRSCKPENDKIDVAALEHISPIEWDNVILSGRRVPTRKGASLCARRRAAQPLVRFGSTPLTISSWILERQIVRKFEGQISFAVIVVFPKIGWSPHRNDLRTHRAMQ